MTSIGSNVGSYSGASSNRGLPVWTQKSLTLEEQVSNFRIYFRDLCFKTKYYAKISESTINKVVEQLRIDPCADITNLLPQDPIQSNVLPTGLPEATPLHWAVLMHDRAMIRDILASGNVEINASTRDRKETALKFALIGYQLNIVEDLFYYKADVGICNENGESALKYMVEKSHLPRMFEILQIILAKNVNMRDTRKNTALHYAAWKKNIDLVVMLIDQKANVNLRNSSGYTPLHYAALVGSLDVVACLLQKKADVNLKNKDGSKPHQLARENGAMNIESLLQEWNANVGTLDRAQWNPLLHSIIGGRVDTSNALIVAGVDVHVKDNSNNNALHLAIQTHGKEHNMVDIVKLLQEHNVDANAKNSQGYSPFFAAVAIGHTDVVKELLQNKEKIKSMEECNGKTAIQIAFDNDHEYIKRVLLECDDVSRYVGDLYRDRQVYVDAANAILVGAALIASVTFASWLQPPLDYTTSYLDLAPSSSDVNYVDVQHNVSLRAFWIFNALSFYFAIGTVVFGARSVLPSQRMFIKDIVEKLHYNLLFTSILLACSVFFVIIAFGIAGCIVLTPTLKFQWYMIAPTIFGGLVCLVCLGFLFKSMLEDYFEKKRETISFF